ncbi:MAG: sigma-54 dependent transcriptional regulator, partial [Holophagales bacterium]|nr:sigma-54 dependent transcriptional regulator [Holophagales bacterium]
RLYAEMELLLTGDIPTLIAGETGVGKEWVARLLHGSSARSRGPFVALSCAAIPHELAEAELFGIGKGVATGVDARPGKLLEADGGTLFLDEVGEMPRSLQAKLLRALQERRIPAVGGYSRPVDVWVLSATNADLERQAASGFFRPDLFFRLAGYRLSVPSLRQRPEDIPALVAHFLDAACRAAEKEIRGITERALADLVEHTWPGNVRELAHEVRALVYRCPPGEAIHGGSIRCRSSLGSGPVESPLGEDLDLERRVRQLEKELIEEALRRARGVRSRAARLLGISRNRLSRKMEQVEVRIGVEAGRP